MQQVALKLNPKWIKQIMTNYCGFFFNFFYRNQGRMTLRNPPITIYSLATSVVPAIMTRAFLFFDTARHRADDIFEKIHPVPRVCPISIPVVIFVNLGAK